MELKVNSGIWGTMFGVPCIVADNLLKLATGEQLKVLLFLLRNSERNISAEEVSANTGVSAVQVQESVLFWQNLNVLASENQAGSFPVMQMTAPVAAVSDKTSPEKQQPAPVENPPPESKPVHTMRKKEYYTPSEMENLVKSSSEIKALFTMAQQALGIEAIKMDTMRNTLLWIYRNYGLKTEVIMTLVQYCCDIDKKSPRYIERIALDWAEKEINTLDSANEEVERLKKYNEFVYKIKRSFEMEYTPTTKQKEFIEQWQGFGFDMEIIHHAYEKCVESIRKLSFEYINKILTSWHEKNITTLEEAKADDKEYKDKKKDSEQTSGRLDYEKYDIFINNI